MGRGKSFQSAAQRALEKQWSDLRLPNATSHQTTPASLAIDLRYAELRVWDRWDYERYIRLAKLLNLTLYELASLACLDHRQIPNLEARNRLYRGTHKDHAGAMVLTVLEAHCAKHLTKDVIEHPFANLNALASTAR